MEIVHDRVPSDGFYDVHRVRLHGEGLYRAYELLCPRDERRISSDVLSIAGVEGLAALWLDRGDWRRKRPGLLLRWSEDELATTRHWLEGLGISAEVDPYNSGRLFVAEPETSSAFFKRLRPYVHTTMRRALRPPTG